MLSLLLPAPWYVVGQVVVLPSSLHSFSAAAVTLPSDCFPSFISTPLSSVISRRLFNTDIISQSTVPSNTYGGPTFAGLVGLLPNYLIDNTHLGLPPGFHPFYPSLAHLSQSISRTVFL